MKYLKNHHFVYKCTYHVVFCPKYRRRILKDGIDTRLKEMILEIADKKGFEVIEMEVMPDHVYLLLSLHPSLGPLDIIKTIKRTTAINLKKEYPEINHKLPNLWTRSAFIATTGSVSLDVVKDYIQNQKKLSKRR